MFKSVISLFPGNQTIWATLCLLSLSFSLSAQTLTLSGRILDRTTEEGLPGATLAIPAFNAGAFSKEGGAFELKVVPGSADSILLQIRYLGYLPLDVRLEAKGYTTIDRDFLLTPEDFSTEDVVITAARGLEQNQSDVTVSIEVVKPVAIDRLATASVNRVIEQIPGVDNLDGQINIRGSSGYAYGAGSRVMVMMDGLPLLSGDAGFAELSLIPVDNIAQVEVLKGASSVLYGSGSIGGVINVITGSPDDKPKTSVRLRQGIYDKPPNPALDWDGSSSAYQSSAHIFHSRKVGSLDLTMQTDFIKDSGYRLGTDKEEFRGLLLTRLRPKKIPGLNIGLNLSTRLDSSGNTLYWRSYHPDTTFLFDNGPDMPSDTLVSGGGLAPAADAGATRKQRSVRLALDPYIKYLTPKGNLFWYRGRFLRNQNENNTNQSSTNFIFYNDFMYQRTLAKKFNWTSGVTFNAFVADGNIYQGRKTGNNVAVYSQLDGKLGRLTTNLGFRLETILMDTLERETRPVFRAGLNYKIAEGTNVRASIGQAFRFPSVAERFTNTEAGRIIIEANPNLQSETGYSAEIAFRQGFRFRGANSLFRGYVDVAGFYTDFNNMVEFGLKDVDFVFAPDLQLIATFKSVNVARARIMGVEVTGNMEGQWGDWYASFNGGITLLDPQNLNAVPEAEQTDLTGFQEDVESGDIIRLLDALNSLDDTTTTDSPPILKYRNRVTVRASASIGYKKLTFTTNVRHRDFMESIDQYLFPVVPDLNYFRTRVNPNGNTAFDFILAYRPTENNEISLNVSNAFNEEYLVVPGRLGEQRQFTFQYLIRF